MEIIAELILGLLWSAGELLLGAAFELLMEVVLHSLGAPFRHFFGDTFGKSFGRRADGLPHPVPTAIGYAMLGGISGGLSLLAAPDGLLHGETLRMVNLLLAPVACGAMMVLIGRWRQRRGQTLVQLDRFGYGYIFALALGAVRYAFAP